jgi:hypothetical protein
LDEECTSLSKEKGGEKDMAQSDEHGGAPNEEPDLLHYADYQRVLSGLSNPELLSALDLALLELEKRLLRYAKVGPEVLEMADEGLVLAVRARARLGQALSSAQHAEGHLQIVGVGEWKPTSTRPAWNTEPRLSEEQT